MALYWAAVLVGIILCHFEYAVAQITITGHETPLIIGLPRDLVCTWSGTENAAKMEWYLFLAGLNTGAIRSGTNTSSLVLSPDPNTSGLDGAAFTCRVTTFNGAQIEETIIVEVRELQNAVSISTSSSTPTAGRYFSLMCNVTSDLPPQVTWLDPAGEPISGPGITLSPQVTNGLITTSEVTFSSLHTSNGGMFTCVSNIIEPPSKGNTTYHMRVQIPPPTVQITRKPLYPAQLFLTNRLVLTCVVLLTPEVDTQVTITSQWTGHPSLSDNHRRVIVSELEGLHPVYQSSVTFSTLKSSDTGSYTCTANVSPVDLRNTREEEGSGSLEESEGELDVLGSQWTSNTLSITVTLNVTIEVTYNPPHDFTLPSPPYYRPATSVTLTCRTHGTTGAVIYNWSSTCSSCFAKGNSSQSVNESILTSSDAGIHTCTATDAERNTGANSTEMKLIGGGIYVANSRYYQNQSVLNNDLAVLDYNCLYNCRKIDFHCYSNSSSSSAGYIYFPNGRRYSNSHTHSYYMVVSRVSPSGIRTHNYDHYDPSYWGIYTCQIPDSNRRTLETNIGIYSSMPSAPSIYDTVYRDLSRDRYSTALGTITCRTRYSPPTNITWKRDGVTIDIDNDRYIMTQTITDRSGSYYDNVLQIMDPVSLAGNHRFVCLISNLAGSASRDISTTLQVLPSVTLTYPENAILNEPYTVTCTARWSGSATSRFNQYLTVEWIGPNGLALNEKNGVTLEEQQTSDTETTRSLIFHHLITIHGGTYKCVAIILFPNSNVTFNYTRQHSINVRNRTIIQLKFGPVLHCSKWYQRRFYHYDLSSRLDSNIRSSIAGIINRNCSCHFSSSNIDNNEFSCQTSISRVVYRARVTTDIATLPTSDLLAPIQDWLTNDGTFLFTAYGRIRLRADPHCQLELGSFTEPECRGTEDMEGSTLSSPHVPSDEL